MPGDGLSAYEEQALHELYSWKHPSPTMLGRVGEQVERGVAAVMQLIPLALVNRVLAWVLPRFRQVTWRATSQPRVLRAYQRAGAGVRSLDEIGAVDLAVADGVAGDKRLHEGAVAGAEGLLAGAFGGVALGADIANVMLLSMRAVQSRGLVYGFDPSADEELVFVLQVLDAATRLGPRSKASARTALSLGIKGVPHGPVLAHMVEELMERLPHQLVTRLGALKSESVAPVVGAITSGGFNAWYLQAVTATARMAYRERFLRRKYGDDLLAAYAL